MPICPPYYLTPFFVYSLNSVKAFDQLDDLVGKQLGVARIAAADVVVLLILDDEPT